MLHPRRLRLLSLKETRLNFLQPPEFNPYKMSWKPPYLPVVPRWYWFVSLSGDVIIIIIMSEACGRPAVLQGSGVSLGHFLHLIRSQGTPQPSWTSAISITTINGYLAEAIEDYGTREEVSWLQRARDVKLYEPSRHTHNHLLCKKWASGRRGLSVFSNIECQISILHTEPDFISFFKYGPTYLCAHAEWTSHNLKTNLALSPSQTTL